MDQQKNSLPKDIQELLVNPSLEEVVADISERYALDSNQYVLLGIAIRELLSGEVAPKAFVPHVAELLKIPRDKAAFISQEVNRDVLDLVKESLKIVHGLVSQPAKPVSPEQEGTTLENTEPGMKTAGLLQPQSVSVPPPPPPIAPTAFNQKLGGAFRLSTPPQASVPNYSAPIAPAQSVTESAPTPTTTPTRTNDPYREPPV